GSCITTSPLSPCDVWVRECKTTRVDSASWYHMRHDCYRVVDACLLQPQARRILAARTLEGDIQGGEDAMRYDVMVIGAGSAGGVLAAPPPGAPPPLVALAV